LADHGADDPSNRVVPLLFALRKAADLLSTLGLGGYHDWDGFASPFPSRQKDFMPRIQQLPMSVITKIAAGEVIERPASVVKELLENSVDAGCTRIDVDVEQGGAELIRVVDDGCGISEPDLALAFANHATSKLKNADDLFAVTTLGFRGEALSSIGGVSQVTLQSRPADEVIGSELNCHGGEMTLPRAWNGSPGTRIEVKHLFYNTPVRRKFLRTPATEMGHICEMVTRLALAKPGIHLTLRHNGKSVYDVPGSASLKERIHLFFSDDVSDHLYEVNAAHGPVRLRGFIANPDCDRGHARMQYLFLNGRWIRDRSLGHAVQEAFRGLLMTGRYAVTFLFLEMPPDHVDVNVHPTKSEVRFRDGNALHGFVHSTIRRRLSEENLTARLRAPMPVGAGVGSTQNWLQPQAMPPHTPSLFSQTGFPTFTKVDPRTRNAGNGAALLDRPSFAPSPPQPAPTTQYSVPTETITPDAAPPADTTPTDPARAPQPDFGTEVFKAIQLHNAYLVLETPEGMLVIDQHALHERVLFEQLQERVRTGTLESQQLLIPEPVELTSEQASRLLEHQADLAHLGLVVEDFGGGTVLVRSYPCLLSRRGPAEILKAVVDHLATEERLPSKEVLLNHLLSTMACHAAVRSGDPLSAEEISALAGLRHLAQDAHHCPHGRPTALLFTRQDLDRQFKRI